MSMDGLIIDLRPPGHERAPAAAATTTSKRYGWTRLQGQRGGEGAPVRVGIFQPVLTGGGVETVNGEIARQLPVEKYAVEGIGWSIDPAFAADVMAYDCYYDLHGKWEELHNPITLERLRAFDDLMRDRRYDVLIMSNAFGPFFAAGLAGVPVIEYWHGIGGWNAYQLPSDLVVAVSYATLHEIEQSRPHHAPATVIHNAVDPARFAVTEQMRTAARKRFGVAPDRQVVLWCGRFSPEKRPGDAMVAFAEARRLNPRLQLLMVGSIHNGQHHQWIDRGAEAGLNWGAEASHHVLAREEMVQAYAAADVLLHTSDSEGLAMVTLEAMAAGLPIISTFAGGCAEALEGVAVRVDVGDTAAMTRAIHGVMAPSQEACRMSVAGRKRVAEQFTSDRQAKQLMVLIDELVRDHRR